MNLKKTYIWTLILKKIIVIFVICIVAILSIGSLLFSKLYLNSYKKDFKTYLKNNKNNIEAQSLQIEQWQLFKNSENLQWEDNYKEIVFNGTLYDLVSIDVINSKIVLKLVSDKQEQSLKNKFADINNINDNKMDSHPLKLLKQFLSLKFINNNEFNFLFFDKVLNYNSNYFLIIISNLDIFSLIKPPIIV